MKLMKIGLFVLCLMPLLSGCNHLYYHPTEMEYREKDSLGFPVTEVWIEREGQKPLHAWLMRDTEDSKGLIVHFHGNAQNLTAHSTFSDWLSASGYTVLIFDYSGYGKTSGEPSQQALIDDTGDVGRYVASIDKWSEKGLPIIVLGQSLGGAVATTGLAAHPEFARLVDLLVIESSFESYQSLARAKLTRHWITWPLNPLAYLLVQDEVKPSEAVSRLEMKKIFIHGNADEVVYFKNGRALFEAAREPKEFWELPFAGHTEAFIPGSPYRDQLLEVLETLKK